MTIGEARRTVDNVVDNLGVLHNHQYAKGVRQFSGRTFLDDGGDPSGSQYVSIHAGSDEASGNSSWFRSNRSWCAATTSVR